MSERTPAQAIARYASTFHATIGGGHVAASPLGAWLLLALVAPIAEGALRTEIEDALGLPGEESAEFARDLLDHPHPSIATALAAWIRDQGEALAPWLDQLPAQVQRGAIPLDVDAWVRKATRQQIKHLPVRIDPLAVLLFVSAVAAAGKWVWPFDVAPSTHLGDSPWTRDVANVLVASDAGHGIRWTPSAGLVGVHVRPTREDFIVTSVIADPKLPREKVIAAAHEVAAGDTSGVKRQRLFDLPLGEGHAWTITEQEVPDHPGSRTQSGRVYLPAWTAKPEAVDLLADRAFGFAAAADALIARLPPDPRGWFAMAAQSTTATFDRHGFSAASVTALEVFAGMAFPPRHEDVGLHRHVDIRFGRPYAVVAVADAPSETEQRRRAKLSIHARPHPWIGVPLFSAWIESPMEPDSRES
jgi:hypothetical protein